MTVPIPASIGPYPIVRCLGVGGMAEVWLGRAVGASGFCRWVAIKRPLPAFREDDELQRLLIAEATLGGRVHHRNLVAVQSLGVADGSYYVVMDYVEGEDLRQLRGAAPLAADIAVHVVAEVLLGLHHLHTLCDEAGRPLGLVHRDVSPSNVLVSVSGEVKLSDYGIVKATFLAGDTAANIRRGKYAYMSREQVAGEPLDARSDQFSVGVMLLELLSGRRPYDAPGLAQVLDRIREAAAPDLRGIPGPLQAVLLRCMAADAADRYPHALALRAALLDAWPAATEVGPPQIGDWVARARPTTPSSGQSRTSTVIDD